MLIACAVLWIAFAGVGLALHEACKEAPVNELGWTDIAGYDSEAYVTWYVNVYSAFSVNHRHPLMGAAFLPITLVGSSVAQRMGPEAGSRAVLVVFALVGALTFGLLWLVMTKAGVPLVQRVVSAALWLSFAHVWILGGIAESFGVSQLILLGVLLMVVCRVRDWRVWTAVGAFAGAVTVTNGVKPFLAWIAGGAQDEDARRMRKRVLLIGAAGGVGLVALGLGALFVKWTFMDKCGFAGGVASVVRDVMECFPTGMSFSHRLWFTWNAFWCEPMMLHGPVVAKTGVESDYSSLLPHVAGVAVLALCVWSAVRNFRLPLVRAMLAMVTVDFVLHVVLGWGVGEGQIYCGHWFWSIPILIALLPRKAVWATVPIVAAIGCVNGVSLVRYLV